MRPTIPDPVYSEALRFTLNWECRGLADELLLSEGRNRHPGALVDDPDDPGGRTAYGITQATYNADRRDRGLPPRDVWLVEAQEVVDIYFQRYWGRLAKYLPTKLAMAVFDTSVLHGVPYATQRLQDVLKLKVDGIVGQSMMGAIEQLWGQPVNGITQDFLQQRDDRYEELIDRNRRLAKFYAGWERRCDDLCDFVGVERTFDRAAA